MSAALKDACGLWQLTIDDLDLIVPHQANGRIIDALGARLRLSPERVWNEIRYCGNTSSSSIPLALTTILHQQDLIWRLGLCSFGAGYTFGGAIIEKVRNSRLDAG
jgi:3-oxoacyl-[acyl-carrier-protein] synthase III